MAQESRRIATSAEAKALSHPVRIRIIRALYDGPLTNNELAVALGRDKATVLHHVRALVATGFLEALPARSGRRGSREQPYRSTGKSWTLSLAEVDWPASDAAMVAAFVQEIGLPHEPVTHVRLALTLDEAGRAELRSRLQEVFDEFVARGPTPGGQHVALYLNVYLPEQGRA